MGGGGWSHVASMARTAQRAQEPTQQVFHQGLTVHQGVSLNGLRVRESRDSAEHPNSRAITFLFDGTGSMGHIPLELATLTLPGFMRLVLLFEPDAQIMFGAFLDFHERGQDKS